MSEPFRIMVVSTASNPSLIGADKPNINGVVIDVSGSMKDHRDGIVNHCNEMIRRLRNEDELFVVFLGDEPRVVFDMCKMTEDQKQKAMNIIDNIHFEGPCNFDKFSRIKDIFDTRPGYQKTILVFTDDCSSLPYHMIHDKMKMCFADDWIDLKSTHG